MKNSSFTEKNGVPYIKIGDEELPLAAYITYFEERHDYKSFTELGFRIFSVTVSTSARPINTESGFMPYLNGIFDEKGTASFAPVDKSIRGILDICPDAYIFPRVYLTMPLWWCNEHPEECDETKDGLRECLYSDAFRRDCGKMLIKLIEHINSEDYADRILGYQISGGNTQEWFHITRKTGSFCDSALPYFNSYLKKTRPDLPPLEKMPEMLFENGMLAGEYSKAYADFANDSVAETVEYFCRVAKEATDYRQIIGSFYGYSLEVINPVEGTHALSKLLDSPYIDFFSSPNSYVNSRPLGIDWGDMMPVDSLKLHGKICFLECDIRTCYSRAPGESRVGADPRNYYTSAVWRGPATEELSAMAMRKCYARQITHRHGFWWFDMFGKWYATDGLRKEALRSLMLVSEAESRALELLREVYVFVDERAYKHQITGGAEARAVYRLRTSLGASGVPYSIYLIEDFERVMKEKNACRHAILATTEDTPLMLSAVDYCAKNGICYTKFTRDKFEFTADEWREKFKTSGVHLYTESGEDVVYAGAGILALHAKDAGEKTLKLPQALLVKNAFADESATLTDTVKFEAYEFETVLFTISKP